jgi:hypothetical protein
MRTVSKPSNRVNPTTTQVPVDPIRAGIIPDDGYAIIFHADHRVELVFPASEDTTLTDGHILLMGIVELMKTPHWAANLIEKTASDLNDAQRESTK